MQYVTQRIRNDSLLLGLIVGLVFGSVDLIYTWLYPYGLKTSTEETKNKYPSFPTIYEQKSKKLSQNPLRAYNFNADKG